jgi:hypothetical protein
MAIFILHHLEWTITVAGLLSLLLLLLDHHSDLFYFRCVLAFPSYGTTVFEEHVRERHAKARKAGIVLAQWMPSLRNIGSVNNGNAKPNKERKIELEASADAE